MTGRSDLVDIACELRAETDKALLVFDGAIEVWLPKSHVEFDRERKIVTLPEWLATAKGML